MLKNVQRSLSIQQEIDLEVQPTLHALDFTKAERQAEKIDGVSW